MTSTGNIGTGKGARETSGDRVTNLKFLRLMDQRPVPQREIMRNLGMYMNYIQWGEYLWMYELYKKQLNVHGYIAEFGTLWGRNLALFVALRTLHEPFNHSRKIIGFDTFEGFTGVHEKDGKDTGIEKGNLSTTRGYEDHLHEVLETHEEYAPIPHIKKFALVKGDVKETLPRWLKDNPQACFSLVYLDVDLYEPSMDVLEEIWCRIPKGGILGLDGILQDRFPGETQAVHELLGLGNLKLQRCPWSGLKSYVVKE